MVLKKLYKRFNKFWYWKYLLKIKKNSRIRYLKSFVSKKVSDLVTIYCNEKEIRFCIEFFIGIGSRNIYQKISEFFMFWVVLGIITQWL